MTLIGEPTYSGATHVFSGTLNVGAPANPLPRPFDGKYFRLAIKRSNGGDSGGADIKHAATNFKLQASEFRLYSADGEVQSQGLTAAAARRSVRETLAAVNLTERARSRMRTLSHGMRKRAMVAQCFVGRPEVVLLDEPLNGLDPVEADRLRRFILSQRGRQTIVISSHNLEDIERLCTHVAFIEKGRVTRMDSVASITHATDRIAFTLTHEPGDIVALSAAVPGASFEWRATERVLVCTFDGESGDVASVNRRLLPALLTQTDVLAVASGLSLEEAFLSRSPTVI